jgi:hypothetical protein
MSLFFTQRTATNDACCFASRPHMTSAYDLGHYYIIGSVFAFALLDTGGRLVHKNNDIVKDERSERKRQDGSAERRREIPRLLMAEAVETRQHKLPQLLLRFRPSLSLCRLVRYSL